MPAVVVDEVVVVEVTEEDAGVSEMIEVAVVVTEEVGADSEVVTEEVVEAAGAVQ